MTHEMPDLRAVMGSVLVALTLALMPSPAQAETASDPVGFYKIDCLGNSDTIVSIPFTRPEAAFALVESVAGDVVTVQGTPDWAVNQFVYAAGVQSNTYYARFLSGPKEGSYFPVFSNGANTLTLQLDGDDISSVTNGSRFSVIPYWTLGTAFPGGKGVIPSPSQFINRRTEILIPSFDGVGINRSTKATYYYFQPSGNPTGAWYKHGDLLTAVDDQILLPDVYFIVRHNTSTGTVFTAQGCVPDAKLAAPLFAIPSGKQDNYLALARPAAVTLDESGLIESGAFSPSPSAFIRTDELFVFDNTTTNKNKTAAATYYYQGNAWRKFGDLVGTWDDEPVFAPGTGFVIRKAAGTSTNWINSPTY